MLTILQLEAYYQDFLLDFINDHFLPLICQGTIHYKSTTYEKTYEKNWEVQFDYLVPKISIETQAIGKLQIILQQ